MYQIALEGYEMALLLDLLERDIDECEDNDEPCGTAQGLLAQLELAIAVGAGRAVTAMGEGVA